MVWPGCYVGRRLDLGVGLRAELGFASANGGQYAAPDD